jgi:hypothetical protein
MAFDSNKEYKPGEKCEASGIYRVTHDRHHGEHEVTVVFDEQFPPCNHCGNHPRFKIVHQAQHVKNHDNFK